MGNISRSVLESVTASRQGGHHTRGRDLADAVIAGVPHIEVAGRVDRQAEGIIKPGADSNPVVGAAHVGSRPGGDDPSRGDLADPVIL